MGWIPCGLSPASDDSPCLTNQEEGPGGQGSLLPLHFTYPYTEQEEGTGCVLFLLFLQPIPRYMLLPELLVMQFGRLAKHSFLLPVPAFWGEEGVLCTPIGRGKVVWATTIETLQMVHAFYDAWWPATIPSTIYITNGKGQGP